MRAQVDKLQSMNYRLRVEILQNNVVKTNQQVGKLAVDEQAKGPRGQMRRTLCSTGKEYLVFILGQGISRDQSGLAEVTSLNSVLVIF